MPAGEKTMIGATARVGKLGNRGVAALEFALVAPVMIIMFFGTLDICRAYIAWQEVNNTAEAVVQAAEKLAVTQGATTTQLNVTQMQAAMSVIYVQMPGLDYGNGDGLLGQGRFAVTLSEVDFAPLCNTTAGCAPQAPQTLWSGWLTEGGPFLDQTSSKNNKLFRDCERLIPVASFPDDDTQLTVMVTPTLAQAPGGGGTGVTLVPQLVADVQFTFKPTLGAFVPQIVFRASATLPAPLGGTAQEVTFDNSAGSDNIKLCPAPPPPA
jgi:hypothetical protein